MDANPNIYSAVVFDLHPKIKEFLDQLDQAGQIDKDEHNAPHVVSLDKPASSVYRCIFMRNGRPENFVMHTRKKAEAVRSWQDGDGFVRQERIIVAAEPENRKERERRKVNPFESIMEQILPQR